MLNSWVKVVETVRQESVSTRQRQQQRQRGSWDPVRPSRGHVKGEQLRRREQHSRFSDEEGPSCVSQIPCLKRIIPF